MHSRTTMVLLGYQILYLHFFYKSFIVLSGFTGKPPWEDNNLADEALTLPLEDQDFRDRDFR